MTEQTTIDIKVHPGAGKNEIAGYTDGMLSVKITAQPEKGKANSALIKLLSDTLGIAKSRIEILRGTTSRRKTVSIEGMSPGTVIDKLTGTS